MILYLQTIFAISLLIIGGLWRHAQTKRRRLSWDETVRAIRAHAWGLDKISERYLYQSGLNVVPAEIWLKIQGVRGLWAMYTTAPLLLHLADLAADCGVSPTPELEEILTNLRRDALDIRVSSLLALAGAVVRLTDTASQNAHRAASRYSEMLVQLTSFIQGNAGQLMPTYLSAM